MDLGKLARGGQQHLRGFGDLALVAQDVRVREDIAGVVACFRRYALKPLLSIAALAVERDVRLRDCNVGASAPVAQARSEKERRDLELMTCGAKKLLNAPGPVVSGQSKRASLSLGLAASARNALADTVSDSEANN